MLYPQKLNRKNEESIFKIAIILSIIIGILLVVINALTTPNIHWAGLCNAGIIYVWITVMYSINKNVNIAGHVLIQTVAISCLSYYIDHKLGFKSWSIEIAIPIILIIANIAMFVLAIVSHKRYLRYAICQLIIFLFSMIPVFLVYQNIVNFKVLSFIATGVSILNLIVSLSLCNKDVKEAVIRKFHF